MRNFIRELAELPGWPSFFVTYFSVKAIGIPIAAWFVYVNGHQDAAFAMTAISACLGFAGLAAVGWLQEKAG